MTPVLELYDTYTYLTALLKASCMTVRKALLNSGPFFLLFCMTSFARYSNASFRFGAAIQKTGKGRRQWLSKFIIEVAVVVLLTTGSHTY